MKKILMLVVVIMAALSVSAQDIRLGGGISLWRNDDADLTSFSIYYSGNWCRTEL